MKRIHVHSQLAAAFGHRFDDLFHHFSVSKESYKVLENNIENKEINISSSV